MEEKKQSLREENSEDKVFVKRGSFVFYKDWCEAIRNFPDNIRLEIYESTTNYAFNGIKPTSLNPEVIMALKFIQATIDRDGEKYDNVCKRNRINGSKPKKEKKAIGFFGKPQVAQKTDNDNNKENDIIIVSEKSADLFATYQLWIEKNATYCSNSEKFKQLTENELWQLTNKYGVVQIKNAILNLANKKSTSKKQTELYKVLSDYLEKINMSF